MCDRSLMDKIPDSDSGECAFDSRRSHYIVNSYEWRNYERFFYQG